VLHAVTRTRLAGNAGSPKIVIYCALSHNFVRLYIFATKACIDNWKETCYNSNTSSRCHPQYSKLRPTNGKDGLAGLGHPSKFQPVSRLGFVTAATSFTGGQPNFAGCLAASCAGTLYIFGGFCPVTEFCHLQTSLCVQVLRSPILAALLYGTRAVGVSAHSLARLYEKIESCNHIGAGTVLKVEGH